MPRREDGEVQCPGREGELQCQYVFAPKDICMHAAPALDAYIQGRVNSGVAAGRRQEQEHANQEQADPTAPLLAHAREEVLTPKCPRAHCRQAFIDFDGCNALRCHSCGCGFCAICFEDCGSDAHEHIGRMHPDDLFWPRERWEAHIKDLQQDRMQQLLGKVWGALGLPVPRPPLPVPPHHFRSGDRVHVKLADNDLYLAPLWFDGATPGRKTYNAIVGRERARFEVLIGNFGGTAFFSLRLDDRVHDYLGPHRCLYNDGWNNVKFDEPGDSLTQKFVLDNDFSTDVSPGARVRIMDRQRFRFMCANMSRQTNDYAGGSLASKFLESWQRPFPDDIKEEWIVERAF